MIKAVIVERGDTLSHIAERMLGDWSKWTVLASFNKLANPHMIRPGDVIKIPGKV